MASLAAVKSAFSQIGCELAGAQIDGCLQLCKRYKITASSLSDEWEAYAMNNQSMAVGKLSLDALRARVQQKQAKMQAPSSSRASLGGGSSRTPGSAVVSRRNVTQASALINMSRAKARVASGGGATAGRGATGGAIGDDFASRFGISLAPSLATGSVDATPKTGKRALGGAGAGAGQSGPPSKMARTGSGGKSTGGKSTGGSSTGGTLYRDRANRDKVVSTFNKKVKPAVPNLLGAFEKVADSPASRSRVEVGLVGGDAFNVPGAYRYMYAPLPERALAMDEQLGAMREALQEAFNLPDPLAPVGQAAQSAVIMCGRVCCDGEGRLNAKSVLIEGSFQSSQGRRALLDLSQLTTADGDGYSLFPGQIIAVQGVCSGRGIVRVSKILNGAAPPRAATPGARLLELNHDSPKYLAGAPMNVVVAAGPYTTADNLEFEPLEDLLANVKSSSPQPDVLVLTGPFVPDRHPMVKAGNITVTEEKIPMTFDELFTYKIGTNLTMALEEMPNLKVVLVPSLDDVHLSSCFPQPPISMKTKSWDPGTQKYEQGTFVDAEQQDRVLCVPNPGTFRINEVTFGVTTADPLFALTPETTSHVPRTSRFADRMAMLAEHPILQRSYFPILPAPEGARVDARKWKLMRMPVQPDVLLLPSRLNSKTWNVRGSLVINPGRLAKGNTGGTYARLTVHPLKRQVVAAAMQAGATGDNAEPKPVRHLVADRTRVEIVRI